MLAFGERHDLILTPVFGGPARRHGEMNHPARSTPRAGPPRTPSRAGRRRRSAPARSPEGLPIGVQVVAAPWRDDVALAAAARIERELGPFPGPVLG